MLLRALRSRSCAVCREAIAKGELAYHWRGAPASRPYRCMRCGEWPQELEGRFDPYLLALNQEAARAMMAALEARPGFKPQRPRPAVTGEPWKDRPWTSKGPSS